MTRQISVATADGYDLDALADLRASWNAGADVVADPLFKAEFRSWFKREAGSRRFWVAYCKGDPVGMVNLMVFDRMPAAEQSSGRWGYLGNMFVREPFRNEGAGTLLVQAALRWADEKQLERVVLNPTDRSIPFYERHGFSNENRLLVRPLPT